MKSGSLVCLKSAYRDKGHPDDKIVGIVISMSDKGYHVLFTDLGGALSTEILKRIELETFYEEAR